MGNALFGTDNKSIKKQEAQDKLDFADACLAKSNTAREMGDHLASLGWQEQSLLVRTEVLGDAVNVNYNQPYLANLIAIGETHLALRRFDRAFIYFLRAKAVLDPLMVQRTTAHTSAPIQYVNLTAGLALVLTAVAKNNHRPTLQLLEGENPLRVAEQVVEQAVIRIVGVEGARAPLLVSLYHILARIYLMTNKRMAALRVMQRCLGLTVHISQTKKVFSFLSYTRNVLDIIKELTLVERVVIRIQQWYRDRVSLRELVRMQEEQAGISLTSAAGGRSSPKMLHRGGSMSTTTNNNNNRTSPNNNRRSSPSSRSQSPSPGASKLFQAATASKRSAQPASLDPSLLQQQQQQSTSGGAVAGREHTSTSTSTTTYPSHSAASPARTLQFVESLSRHSDVLLASSSAHFLPSPALLHAIDQSDLFKEDEALVQRRMKAAMASAEVAAKLLMKAAALKKKPADERKTFLDAAAKFKGGRNKSVSAAAASPASDGLLVPADHENLSFGGSPASMSLTANSMLAPSAAPAGGSTLSSQGSSTRLRPPSATSATSIVSSDGGASSVLTPRSDAAAAADVVGVESASADVVNTNTNSVGMLRPGFGTRPGSAEATRVSRQQQQQQHNHFDDSD